MRVPQLLKQRKRLAERAYGVLFEAEHFPVEQPQRLLREGLHSPHLDSRRAGALPLEVYRALSDPALQAKVSDLEFAHAVLVLDADPIEDMPILDLRLRKGVRRHGMKLLRAGAASAASSSFVVKRPIAGNLEFGWSIRADTPTRLASPAFTSSFPHWCSFFDVRPELLVFS